MRVVFRRTTPRFTLRFPVLLSLLVTLMVPLQTTRAWASGPSGARDDRSQDGTGQVTPEQREEARARFARGVQAFEDGDYKLALIEFNRAYAIAPAYRMLYNIGQVNQQLGQYTAALDALVRYLAEGGDRIPEARRAEVERDIEVLRGRTATVAVRSNQAGAEVYLDDRRLGVTPLGPVTVDAGEHRVVVRRAGFRPFTQSVVLAGGDALALDARLEREAVNVATVLEKPEPTRPWVYVTWGATGVLATSAVVFGVLASTNADELKSMRTTLGTTEEERAAVQSRARTFAVATDVLAGAALLSGAAALYLTLKRSSSDRSPAKPSVAFAGTGVVAYGEF